jgi:uncharacterized membrane protein YgcG
MRFFVALLASAVLLPSASLADTSLAFGPDTHGSSVTYRFTTTMERPQSAFQDPSDANASPPPPRIDTQTIAFTPVDATHVRLTVVDPSTATPDTLVADRDADGTLHAKLHRGNRWALPIALYDRVLAITAASANLKSGGTATTRLQPIASTDTIDGKLSATQAKDTMQIAFDGTGDVTPSRELLFAGQQPAGGPNVPGNGGGPGGFGGRGGGFGGGGGGFGGGGFGRGGGGGRHGGPFGAARKAAATVDGVAAFRGNALVRADSTETLAIGEEGATAKQTWSVERVPS